MSQSTSDPLSLPIAGAARSVISGFRWAFLISAIVALIIGIALLFWPARTLTVAAAALGVYFIVIGIIRIAVGIFSSASTGSHSALTIILGILLLLAGIIALRNLAATAAVLILLTVAVVGVGFITSGILEITESRGTPSSGWAIAGGILSIVVGIIVVIVPVWSGTVLMTFAGICLVILGVVGIVRSIALGRDIKAVTG